MSGYKRVNFYELCRLCATNQQKEKTHIFTEEGRKIQLQNKIQSCLSLTVCETDFLPKVVCSKCLRSLEVCYSFRQECVTSETMLSSYFKNFRYTEDFKKSGKVYIKDTTSKPSPESVTSTTSPTSNITTTVVNNTSFTPTVEAKPQITHASQVNQPVDHIPFYTLQLPTLVTNQHSLDKQILKQEVNQSKIIQNTINNPQVAYNLNTINLAALKSAVQATPKVSVNEGMSNVVVNANGEVINIAQLVDIESLINQSQIPKVTKTKSNKRLKEMKSEIINEENIIKIDLTESDNQTAYDTGQTNQIKYEKLPHIKSTQNDKYTYTVKVDESKNNVTNVNPTVIFNTMTNYQQIPNSAGNYQSFGNANGYPPSGINIVTTAGTNSLATTNICSTPVIEPTTVNLNVLNQNISEVNHINHSQNYARNMQQQHQNHPTVVSQNNFTNVISSISTQSQNLNNNHNNSSIITSSSNNSSNNSNNNASNNIMSPSKYTINQNTIPINNVHITTANNVNINVSPITNTNLSVTSNNNISNGNNNNNSNSNNNNGNVLLNGQKIHVCEVCQKNFKRKEHLYQHVKLHTGFRPYACENCNKSFMRKEHLLRHMTSHSGQKNFTCNICDKSFSRNDNLLKHKKTHEKQSSYSCEICNKQFVMKHYYMVHKLTHEDDQVKNICVLKA